MPPGMATGGMATHIINDLTSILPGARVGWWYQLAREMRPSRTMTAVVASEESWFSRWNVEYIAAAWCCCDVVRRSAFVDGSRRRRGGRSGGGG